MYTAVSTKFLYSAISNWLDQHCLSKKNSCARVFPTKLLVKLFMLIFNNNGVTEKSVYPGWDDKVQSAK